MSTFRFVIFLRFSQASAKKHTHIQYSILLYYFSGLYPKWLIEVEKKRADAELIRAKAEEQRTNIAAKNAEAAIIQAEALKKLADASTLQADAMARIAALLENRVQKENNLLTI